MSVALPRNLIALPACVAAALLLGALIAVQPTLAVGAVGALFVLAVAFRFPVAHLVMLIAVTAIVPYGFQNAYGIGGGTGSVGLLLSDLFLLTGLLRAVLVLATRPLDRARLLGAVIASAFLLVVAVQFLHGVALGGQMSEAGTELRTLLGFGALLIALPFMTDQAARSRLLRGLLGVGLALGLWGLIQWTLNLSFADGTGDFGVREGVRLTSDGRGQLQGGLYGFPVAVVLAFSVLLSGQLRTLGPRLLVGAALALNAICVLLTFERTFWVVTVLACGFVAVRSGRVQRARAVVLAPLLIAVVLVPLGTLAPDLLTTARERLLSLGQYASDSSVDYRIRESGFVAEEIETRPVTGNGLGATVYWGRPSEGVPPQSYTYAHNGYLWAAWKLGIPAALLLFGGLAWGIARRGPPRRRGLFDFARVGAQGALLALLVACVTFPAVTELSITPTMGVMLAFCTLPRRSADE